MAFMLENRGKRFAVSSTVPNVQGVTWWESRELRKAIGGALVTLNCCVPQPVAVISHFIVYVRDRGGWVLWLQLPTEENFWWERLSCVGQSEWAFIIVRQVPRWWNDYDSYFASRSHQGNVLLQVGIRPTT